MYRWRISGNAKCSLLGSQQQQQYVCVMDVHVCLLHPPLLACGWFHVSSIEFDFYLAFKVYCNVGQRCSLQTCSCVFFNIACIALASALCLCVEQVACV
jgi:hypothetical protein